ncbi:nitrous oxide reductase family maturation protein NosD [Pusillimonas sp. ANT_WB101]|uniref:nitrous oxide reductase family maturation protein NosD n=1 Tax=Pusillimonas sp. ANT_WB101 TaxID=2597356 RepID=UPI002104B966|nr:nitrous oxide reductase family maturation protein NosD [Pusillimonas sp. ANT_WB101]
MTMPQPTRSTSHLAAKAGMTLAALLLCAGPAGGLLAATYTVAAGDDLQVVIDAAEPGDVLRLAPGNYAGNIVVSKPLTLEGPESRQAVIAGTRNGRTVWIKGERVTLRNVTVTLSGLSLPDMDAGIFLDRTANKALIENNDVLDNSVGVYVWGPTDALVRNNRIVGNKDLRMAERGNGVTLWNSPGTHVVGNHISYGRDGIFVNTSKNNRFEDNHFSNLRYGVHYMNADNSQVVNNVSEGNDIGYAIMYSKYIEATGNASINDREQGLMFNYANQSIITGNAVIGSQKCVFIYNANNNRIQNNHFEGCGIGVHFTAGSTGNTITGNAFVGNRNQVKYVGTRHMDWSDEGRGNYWSDNSAFDLNGDGVADTAYRPNDIIDQVVWRAPSAQLLLNSPAVSLVRWAQTQFPAILPGGVIDSAPLMQAPDAPALRLHIKDSS